MDPLLTVTDFNTFADANFRAKYLNPDGSLNQIAHEELNWFAKQIAARMGEAKDAAALAQSLAAALNTSWATLPNRYQSLATTVYVNATTGNDVTGTGAIGSPVATLTRAAALVNDKFHDVTIEVQTNLTVSASVTFSARRVVIRHVARNITLAKIAMGAEIGDGNQFIANASGDLVFVGADTAGGTKGQIVVTAGNGYTGSGGANLNTWRANNGAIRAGSALAPQARVTLIRCDVQVGANTTLVASCLDGAILNPLYEVRMEQRECAWTLGAAARVGNFMAGTYYRASVQLNSTWKTLMAQNELILQSGTYAVRLKLTTMASGGATFDTFYAGVLAWYMDNAINDFHDETQTVALHRMGQDPNGTAGVATAIGLRTKLRASSNDPIGYPALLEINSAESLTSAALVEVFFNKIA